MAPAGALFSPSCFGRLAKTASSAAFALPSLRARRRRGRACPPSPDGPGGSRGGSSGRRACARRAHGSGTGRASTRRRPPRGSCRGHIPPAPCARCSRGRSSSGRTRTCRGTCRRTTSASRRSRARSATAACRPSMARCRESKTSAPVPAWRFRPRTPSASRGAHPAWSRVRPRPRRSRTRRSRRGPTSTSRNDSALGATSCPWRSLPPRSNVGDPRGGTTTLAAARAAGDRTLVHIHGLAPDRHLRPGFPPERSLIAFSRTDEEQARRRRSRDRGPQRRWVR